MKKYSSNKSRSMHYLGEALRCVVATTGHAADQLGDFLWVS